MYILAVLVFCWTYVAADLLPHTRQLECPVMPCRPPPCAVTHPTYFEFEGLVCRGCDTCTPGSDPIDTRMIATLCPQVYCLDVMCPMSLVKRVVSLTSSGLPCYSCPVCPVDPVV